MNQNDLIQTLRNELKEAVVEEPESEPQTETVLIYCPGCGAKVGQIRCECRWWVGDLRYCPVCTRLFE